MSNRRSSELAKPVIRAMQGITNRISNRDVGVSSRAFSSGSNTALIMHLCERTGAPLMKDDRTRYERLRSCGSISESIGSSCRRYGNSPDGEEEFWVVEGEMLRIRGIQDRSLLKIIEKGGPPAVNPNLTKKQIAAARLKRVMACRLTQTEKGQETYWATYFERYRNMREQAEKLYWDGKPAIEHPVEVVDKNDPFTILGLKKREKPYSPVELRAAYRKMALKYHPDHNPGEDTAAKFERIWNAYKMLQHKRSWR